MLSLGHTSVPYSQLANTGDEELREHEREPSSSCLQNIVSDEQPRGDVRDGQRQRNAWSHAEGTAGGAADLKILTRTRNLKSSRIIHKCFMIRCSPFFSRVSSEGRRQPWGLATRDEHSSLNRRPSAKVFRTATQCPLTVATIIVAFLDVVGYAAVKWQRRAARTWKREVHGLRPGKFKKHQE